MRTRIEMAAKVLGPRSFGPRTRRYISSHGRGGRNINRRKLMDSPVVVHGLPGWGEAVWIFPHTESRHWFPSGLDVVR